MALIIDRLQARLARCDAVQAALDTAQKRNLLAAIRAYGDTLDTIEPDDRIQFGLVAKAFLADTAWVDRIATH